jgi:RNA polymerase sigma factor (sigma-70 family)
MGERTDRELLRAFAMKHDESAFVALVHRHGPLVLGVCRRLLGHEQDAEDAFQATFLVLARKAGCLPGDTIGGWLHGVAWNIAQRLRRARARQYARDAHASMRELQGPVAEASLRELQALLDAEVARLPEKLRSPFVLCCLEGRAKAEAARELGWKEGTVSSRLAQARERLRARLVRRGVTLTAALTAVAVAHDASASLPAALARATCAAARAFPGKVFSTPAELLAHEVLRSGMPKARLLAAALVAVIVTASVGGWAFHEEQTPTLTQQPAKTDQTPLEKPRLDRHGDPLPPGAIMRLGTERLRHAGSVHALAYSPDGKTIASGADDYTVGIWDAATGRKVGGYGWQQGCTFALAFTSDGKWLAAGNLGGEITVWETAGNVVRQFEKQECSIKSLAFLPGDKQLVSGGSDGILQVLDVTTGKRI